MSGLFRWVEQSIAYVIATAALGLVGLVAMRLLA